MAIPQGEVSSTAGFTLAACAFSFLVALIIGYLHGKLEFAEHKHQIMLQDKIEAEHACKHLIKLISKDHLHGNPQNDGVGPKIYQNAATQVDGRPDRSIRSSSAEDLVDLESDHAIDGLHDAEPVPEPLDLQYRGIRTSHDEIGPDPYAEYMAEVSHSRLDIAAPSVEKSPGI